MTLLKNGGTTGFTGSCEGSMRDDWKAQCPITGSIITLTEIQYGFPLPKTSFCDQKCSPSLGDSWMQR